MISESEIKILNNIGTNISDKFVVRTEACEIY